jgi:hypothetical protein
MKKLILIGVLAVRVCGGTIIHVPSEYPTIGDGLDAASTGDTVLVAPGEYSEKVFFSTRGVKLISEAGPDSTTITNAAGVIASTGSDTTNLVEGFTLTGSTGGAQNEGGAVRLWGQGMTFRNNIVTGNSCGKGGGGFWLEKSNTIIEDNVISNNRAGNCGGAVQVYADYGGPYYVTIRNNTITGNSAAGMVGARKAGGAIAVAGNTTLTIIIEGNVITDNHGDDGVGGIALAYGGSNATITGNDIRDNDSVGIETTWRARAVVNHNTISGHTQYGIRNLDGTSLPTMDAEHNCWDDPSGPYHPTLNPGGGGDVVSDNVDFDPWDPCTTGVELLDPIEKSYTVSNCYPNPFTEKTIISYRLGALGHEPKDHITHYTSHVTLAIHDLSGRLVKFFNLCNLNQSVKSVLWDGTDQFGKTVSPGMYFCRLLVNGKGSTTKLVKLR